MATQFMPPSSFMTAAPVPGYHGYTNGKTGGFSFRKRMERVDWRKISMVDIENISRTLDFSTLQENIMNITFCNLEAELDIRSVDPNFVKLFKLAQLTIEYLLHSQEFLAGLCSSLEEKTKQSDQEVEKIKQEVEALQKELAEVKKESHKRKKMLIAQQQLLHVGNESYNKCPFCAKAFINNAYLQSHIVRRHSGATRNKDGSSSVSPDLGVGSESGRNNLEVEILHLKERLLKYEEAQHHGEQHIVKSQFKETRVNSTQLNQNASLQMDNTEEGEKVGMSAALMKELRELNAKYQASQRALRELESRTGGKRSYLGDLEDEIENEKELLKEQRSEVAAVKEQLQQQMDLMKNHMEKELSKQERKWQKKVHHMTQQHSSEIKKLNNALETTSKSQEGLSDLKQNKNQHDVQEILRQSREREKELEVQEQLMEREIAQASEVKLRKTVTSTRAETSRNATLQNGSEKYATSSKVKHSQMYPSDNEGTTGFDTGTSSLRTFNAETPGSTMGQTGTQSLHTMQFLEELRKNPTLAVMREQLAELLQEQLEKKGIPPGQTGITDNVLKSKLAILSTQRQMHVKKYPNFNELREHFNNKATDEARKRLRMQSASPWGQPPQELSPRSASLADRPRSGPPHPQQHLSAQRASLHSPGSQGQGPNHRTQIQSKATTSQNSRRPLSTGSTTEWTSTQFGSDDDSLEDDDDADFKGGKAVAQPGVRLIQSGPARDTRGPTPSPRFQGPKPRLIQSKPLNNNAEDAVDLNRENAKLTSAPGPSNLEFKQKADLIEKKLGGRTGADKPFGGVNVGGAAHEINKQKQKEGDSDVESDWDDTEVNEPAPAVAKQLAPRGSTDVSNTYGSSAWGSSSKAASTIKDKDHRSTSRSSFVSITDVSTDDENV